MRRSVVLEWLLVCVSVVAQTPAAIWIDVPFVSQPREGCGAASLSMVMQYWAAKQGTASSPDSDVARIQRQLFSRSEHGIPAEQMRAYLLQHGYQAFAFRGRWSDIEEQIAKGRPLIVALKPEGQSELHYVVVDGVDSNQGLVTMNDPAVRKLINEERRRFEKEWSATQNWTLLAVPASSSR
ncbi:MAG: C39 family peptidase [Acidobacteria bacterium]|nr:C39 family peptidase [Acidobacteriota bacterium]